jgi:hypothetical protein
MSHGTAISFLSLISIIKSERRFFENWKMCSDFLAIFLSSAHNRYDENACQFQLKLIKTINCNENIFF